MYACIGVSMFVFFQRSGLIEKEILVYENQHHDEKENVLHALFDRKHKTKKETTSQMPNWQISLRHDPIRPMQRSFGDLFS